MCNSLLPTINVPGKIKEWKVSKRKLIQTKEHFQRNFQKNKYIYCPSNCSKIYLLMKKKKFFKIKMYQCFSVFLVMCVTKTSTTIKRKVYNLTDIIWVNNKRHVKLIMRYLLFRIKYTVFITDACNRGESYKMRLYDSDSYRVN